MEKYDSVYNTGEEKELQEYADLFKQDVAFDCCCHFWYANNLQNILNIPLECCGYCGRRLTDKEFKWIYKKQYKRTKGKR